MFLTFTRQPHPRPSTHTHTRLRRTRKKCFISKDTKQQSEFVKIDQKEWCILNVLNITHLAASACQLEAEPSTPISPFKKINIWTKCFVIEIEQEAMIETFSDKSHKDVFACLNTSTEWLDDIRYYIFGRYFQHPYCDPLTETISAPLDPTDQCFEVKMQTWGIYIIYGAPFNIE